MHSCNYQPGKVSFIQHFSQEDCLSHELDAAVPLIKVVVTAHMVSHKPIGSAPMLITSCILCCHPDGKSLGCCLPRLGADDLQTLHALLLSTGLHEDSIGYA